VYSATPLPPSTWYIHSVGSPPRKPPLLATMYLPSGEYSGERYTLARPRVTSFTSFVARSSVCTLSAPCRSEMNTSVLPSGLNRGWVSKARPLVSRVASPPANGMR
jgi:hypothetical protein